MIELFTARAKRRLGLARTFVCHSMDVVAVAGHNEVALRVAADNLAAVALYRDFGFREWPQP